MDAWQGSTLAVIYELGILDEFLKRPHHKLRQIAGQIGDGKYE
jgi:hypothetical protein